MSAAEPSTTARKDDAHIDRDWVVRRRLIDGVKVREVRNVVTGNGITTELYRPDWDFVDGTVQQAIHVALRGSAISAWHQHQHRWDYVFTVGGHLRIVLHDPREGSPTRDQVDVFHLSPSRPSLLAIPPGVWHGVQNLRDEPGGILNLVDRAYSYRDPDHWRLPLDSPRIPFSFTATRLR